MSNAGAATYRIADPDSRARTHLANERTFLAWLRTGLSLVAVGLAAANFLPLDLVPGIPFVTVASVALVVLGTFMVLFGAARYRRAHQLIEAGSYVPAVWPIVAVGVIVAVLAALALPLVVRLR
jgi:putative membrane protein